MASKNKGRRNLIKKSKTRTRRWYMSSDEQKMHKHLERLKDAKQ